MNYQTLKIDRRGASVWIWMNRPEVHNAFDETLIAELTDAFAALDADDAVRAIVLAGEGKSFSAGADLNWMKRQGASSAYQNLVDATQMSQAEASPMPPPSAAPCTRARVGVRHDAMVRNSVASFRASARFCSRGAAPWRFIQFRSAPAEKLLPSPASTMTRTPASASSVAKALVSSAISFSSNAL